MYSLRKLLWFSFLGIGGLLLLIIILGGRQMQLNRQFSEVISQLQGIALGGMAMVFIARIDYRMLRKPTGTGGRR